MAQPTLFVEENSRDKYFKERPEKPSWNSDAFHNFSNLPFCLTLMTYEVESDNQYPDS